MAKRFLERLVRVYGAPSETKDVTGFLTEYQNALTGYSDDVLMTAADRMFRDRKYKSWPSIGDCVAFVKTVQLEADFQAEAKSLPLQPKHRSKPAMDKKDVDAILRKSNEMTQRACAEGWIVGLHDFVRDKHRLPKPDERSGLRANANYVEACATGDNDLGVMHFELVKLAQVMVARRATLSEEFA